MKHGKTISFIVKQEVFNLQGIGNSGPRKTCYSNCFSIYKRNRIEASLGMF